MALKAASAAVEIDQLIDQTEMMSDE